MQIEPNIIKEKKTRLVFFISLCAMVIEVALGYLSKSIALTAEGWHLGTHVFAIGISWLVYVAHRQLSGSKKYAHRYNPNFLFSFAGLVNAGILVGIACWIAYESVNRLLHYEVIDFFTAFTTAILGLVVNFICLRILHQPMHDKDTNYKAAYIHFLSDLVSGIIAIVALLLVFFLSWTWMDALSGMVSSIIILLWSVKLCKESIQNLTIKKTR